MKKSDIRKLIDSVKEIDNRGENLTNKGFIFMLENLLTEDHNHLPEIYFFDTADQKIFKSKRYGTFVISKFGEKVLISWYKDRTFVSEILLPSTISTYKRISNFSDVPKDGWFEDFDSAEMYLIKKFGKLYK